MVIYLVYCVRYAEKYYNMSRKSVRLLMLLAIVWLMASCKVGRFFIYNFADIKDYKKFPSRGLTAAPVPFRFYATEKGKFPKEVDGKPFGKFLEDNKTVAFLIIRHDTIQYEQYFKGYSRECIVPSFSVAKSVTSILIGCAIDDGFIKSVEEPVTNYIPELRKRGFDKVTIAHLLQMTSGLRFNESYFNPFGDAASFYYGRRLRKQIARMKLKAEPGQRFEYTSGSTQLLGMVLERALKQKTITGYLQEKIWDPLGMEYDASWSIDKKRDGIEKAFCCLNARAVDFAKIGRLYQNKGNWNGKQVVSAKWIEQSTKPDLSAGGSEHYRYQWWLPTPNEDFMAQGILGQFVYVHPAKNLVIVRLGKTEGKTDWWTVFTSLARAY